MASNQATSSVGNVGNGIVEQMLAMQSMQSMQALMNNKDGWSKNHVMSLLMVTFMDTFKKTVESVIQNIISNKDSIISYVMRLCGVGWCTSISIISKVLFINLFRRLKYWVFRGGKNRGKEEVVGHNDCSEQIIEIDFKPSLREWNSILESAHLKFVRTSKFKFERKDAMTSHISEIITNLRLCVPSLSTNTPPFTVEFKDDLNVTWDVARTSRLKTLTSVLKSGESENVYKMRNLNTLRNLTLFPEFVRRINDAIKFRYIIRGANVYKKYESHMVIAEVKSGIFNILLEHLEKGGVTFADKESMTVCTLELAWLLTLGLCHYYNGSHWLNNAVVHNPVPVTIGIFEIKTTISINYFRSLAFIIDLMNDLSSNFFQENQGKEVGKWVYEKWMKKEVSNTNKKQDVDKQTELKIEPETTTEQDVFPIQIRSSLHYDNSTLFEAWQTYLIWLDDEAERAKKARMISHDKGKEGNSKFKSKTFDLRIKEREHVEKRANPEFEVYESKLRDLDNMNREGDNKGCNLTMSLINSRPNKEIETVIKEKYVVKTLVNEMHRDLSTLYLRERDEKNLANCLYNFKDNQSLLSEMGISNKLGVMLYGLPGTGKSSTITAIATTLEKDVYYLHLNEIQTNSDLKMVFDFVFKECADGIIVMEDIDAMTDVVKKRSADTINHYKDKDVLTLEFILNLLQGSLTIDGSIFVATTNHIDVLDPAFYRQGRFDVLIEMRPCDRYQVRKIFRKFFSRDLNPEILSQVPENVYTPATIIGHLVQYLMRGNEETDETIMSPFLEVFGALNAFEGI